VVVEGVDVDVVAEADTDVVVDMSTTTGATGVRVEGVMNEVYDDEESMRDCCADVFLLFCIASAPPTPPPIPAPRTKSKIAKTIQNIRTGSPHI
jgi:hypothetical protein